MPGPPAPTQSDASGFNFDFDLARFGRFLVGEAYAQDPVLVVGGDLFGIEGIGHREAAAAVTREYSTCRALAG